MDYQSFHQGLLPGLREHFIPNAVYDQERHFLSGRDSVLDRAEKKKIVE
jgi:hypothetical protein